jgi:DNA-binding response OmpR family regulator
MSSELLLLTSESDCEAVLPSLALLPHRVRTLPADPGAILSGGTHDVILVDARTDLAGARDLCRLLSAGDAPVVALVNEGGLVTISAEWGVDDILLPTTGPAEIDARLRLLVSRRTNASTGGDGSLSVGDLMIEEATYTARLKGRALELTYKEFELLKFLAQHAGRVFTRAQLLQEVWGYDFFGGTRTVDVHVRRLRAKLGPEHDSMIGTVRNVGYKFVRPNRNNSPLAAEAAEAAEAEQAEFEAMEREIANTY